MNETNLSRTKLTYAVDTKRKQKIDLMNNNTVIISDLSHREYQQNKESAKYTFETMWNSCLDKEEYEVLRKEKIQKELRKGNCLLID